MSINAVLHDRFANPGFGPPRLRLVQTPKTIRFTIYHLLITIQAITMGEFGHSQ